MAANPVILITGANTGLGFQIVQALHQSKKAYIILLAGRNIDKANVAAQEAQSGLPSSSSVISTLQIDLEDDDSISQAFEQVANRYGRLDVLVNNAGAMFDTQQQPSGKSSLREMWNTSWNVNTTGTHIVTHTFAPLLLKSSNPRLLFLTSGTATLSGSENTTIPMNFSPPKGWPKESLGMSAYRSAKTGLNMMMRQWARILKEDGVKVWSISPGLLATGLGGNPELTKKLGGADPAEGANLIRDVIEGGWDQDVGKVIGRTGIQPW